MDLRDAVVQNLRKVFLKCHEYGLHESHIGVALGASAEGENLARADIVRGEDGRWRLHPTLQFSGFDS
jgi:hypothetical protein